MKTEGIKGNSLTKIYKITNKLNNKAYIGQTKQNVKTRFSQHILGMGLGKKMPIHLALQKYGKENFILEEIYYSLDSIDANYSEVYFINLHNTLSPNGYNVDFNTNSIKDNPYLIEESKNSSAVQSLGSETEKSEYLPTRPRYPYQLWMDIKYLYEEGKSPSDINKIMNLNIPNYTIVNKLKDLGCTTSNKARNKFRGNNRFKLSKEEKLNIIKDFKNGLSCVQLERKYKRSSKPIKQVLVDEHLYISKDKKISRTLE